jgi:hypothetical protein
VVALLRDFCWDGCLDPLATSYWTESQLKFTITPQLPVKMETQPPDSVHSAAELTEILSTEVEIQGLDTCFLFL